MFHYFPVENCIQLVLQRYYFLIFPILFIAQGKINENVGRYTKTVKHDFGQILRK